MPLYFDQLRPGWDDCRGLQGGAKSNWEGAQAPDPGALGLCNPYTCRQVLQAMLRAGSGLRAAWRTSQSDPEWRGVSQCPRHAHRRTHLAKGTARASSLRLLRPATRSRPAESEKGRQEMASHEGAVEYWNKGVESEEALPCYECCARWRLTNACGTGRGGSLGLS